MTKPAPETGAPVLSVVRPLSSVLRLSPGQVGAGSDGHKVRRDGRDTLMEIEALADEFLDRGETVQERTVFANLAVAELHEVRQPARDHAPGGVQPAGEAVEPGGAVAIHQKNVG